MTGRIYRPEQSTVPAFPIIGKVHIGKKQTGQNGKEYPVSLDYFVATGKYAELFTEAFGEKPGTIQIVFPSDDVQMVCEERFTYRDNSGALVARGDGRTFEVWNGKTYAPYLVDEHPDIMERIAAKNPTKRGTDNWDEELTLRFIIPAVRRVVGMWTLQTKGKASSVRNLRDSFDAVQKLRGTVTTSVFDLSVSFHKSNKPGQTSRYPVLELVCNDVRIAEVREMLKQEIQQKMLLNGQD